MGRDRLTGKRALITGGDSGIGRAIAIAFAKEGAAVAITHLPEEADDAASTASVIRALGGTCELLPADLRAHKANVDVAKKAVQALGGSIIVTTSVQAYTPSDHLLDYAATKAALNNLVVNLAGDLGAQGTRVNAVAPGPIWTPLIPATMSEKKVSGFGADTPRGAARGRHAGSIFRGAGRVAWMCETRPAFGQAPLDGGTPWSVLLSSGSQPLTSAFPRIWSTTR